MKCYWRFVTSETVLQWNTPNPFIPILLNSVSIMPSTIGSHSHFLTVASDHVPFPHIWTLSQSSSVFANSRLLQREQNNSPIIFSPLLTPFSALQISVCMAQSEASSTQLWILGWKPSRNPDAVCSIPEIVAVALTQAVMSKNIRTDYCWNWAIQSECVWKLRFYPLWSDWQNRQRFKGTAFHFLTVLHHRFLIQL
jgi:hypothetical protein